MWEWLTHRQSTRIRSTDQILQLAQHIRESKETERQMHAEVRGTITAALNGREPLALVESGVDLSRTPRGILPADWIERPSLPSLSDTHSRLATVESLKVIQ